MRANDGDRLATARMKGIEDPILRSLISGIMALSRPAPARRMSCLALGLAACQRGFSVAFFTAAGLVHQLMEARDERRLLKLQAQLAAVKLLIIDELGYVPLSQTGAELLFEIFSQRHERGSTIVTSNLPFEEWTSVFGSQRLTGALLDRLTHHVHILELNGESYRLKQSKARRRREPRPADEGAAGDPKPAKSPPLPESRVRPGYETPTISAGADAARRALRPAANWPGFAPPQWPTFTPALTGRENPRTGGESNRQTVRSRDSISIFKDALLCLKVRRHRPD